MPERVTYVSSIENNYKKAKLNNVIKSLNDLVTCTTPDETVQDYGLLDYYGEVSVGQLIHGNKPSRKANTPVVVNNVYLGNIDSNGVLKVTNTEASSSSYSVTSRYCDIQYTVCGSVANTCTSTYWCDCCKWTTCVECFSCIDTETNETYTCKITCCTFTACVHERCVFLNAYRTVSSLDCGFVSNMRITSTNGKTMCPTSTAIAKLDGFPGSGEWNSDHDGFRGSYYPTAINMCYFFDEEKLCYCVCYPMASREQFLHSTSSSPTCQNTGVYGDNCHESTSLCLIGTAGPFLNGFSAETGKMAWCCNPTSYSVTVAAQGNSVQTGHFSCCCGYGDYCYCTWYNNNTYSANCVRATHLMVCSNSVFCCTICVAQKLRNVKNICIHERYL